VRPAPRWARALLSNDPVRPSAITRRADWIARRFTARPPSRATQAPHEPGHGHVTEESLRIETSTLIDVAAGLDRLQVSVEQSPILTAAEARGYLTPDEDDRVRQALLAYRNYRLVLYDIILRLEDYRTLRPAGLRLRAFMVAFAAALTLYARSLQLQQLAAQSPLVRGKLNEPEPKFELEAGFFDEVMEGYGSLRNYGLVWLASWFWLWRRRAIRRLVRREPQPWAEVERLIVAQRKAFKTLLLTFWRHRWQLGWHALWTSLASPAQHAQYALRSRVGRRFANSWLQPGLHQPVGGTELLRLRGVLQPGDVLVMRAEGKLTASLLPGFWAHAALHLGEGNQIIEAVSSGVRIVSLEECLDADHVLVLRPRLTPEERTLALEEARRHLHKPYDFEFDFNLSSRLVCTGLVYRSLHGRGPVEFTLRKRLGRHTLTGDDLVSQAVAPSESRPAGMDPVLLILRCEHGWLVEDTPEPIRAALQRITNGWRPVGDGQSHPASPGLATG